MKAVMAIAVREWIDRRNILVAALVAAIVPLVLPLVPGIGWSSPGDIRGAMAWGMSLGLTWVLSLFLGATLLGPELSEGRLGFYFTRPISGLSIWVGKVLSALLLAVVCEVVILLPAVIIPGSELYFNFIADEPWLATVGLVFGIPLFLIVAAHALSVMFRSKSAWLFVDLVALITLLGFVFHIVARFFIVADTVFTTLVVSSLIVFLIALLTGGGWQIVSGRCDLRRGHGILSVWLWSIMACFVLALAMYTGWFFSVAPHDLTRIYGVDAAPKGPWVATSGECAARFDYTPKFLVNLDTGVHLPFQTAWNAGWFEVSYAKDGSTAVWARQSGPKIVEIQFADLTEAQPKAENTQLVYDLQGQRIDLTLSDDGRAVLISELESVSLFELRSGRLLSAARLPKETFVARAVFVSEDVVWLLLRTREHESWSHDSWLTDVKLVEFSPSGLRSLSEATELRSPCVLMISDDASQAYLAYMRDKDWISALYSLPSFELIEEFPQTRRPGFGMFLRDGRFLRAVFEDGEFWLKTPAVDERQPVSMPIGEGEVVCFNGQLSDGRVVVAPDRDSYRTLLVDLDSVSTEALAPGYRPAMCNETLLKGVPIGSQGSTLFMDADRHLFRLDPESGECAPVLGRR